MFDADRALVLFAQVVQELADQTIMAAELMAHRAAPRQVLHRADPQVGRHQMACAVDAGPPGHHRGDPAAAQRPVWGDPTQEHMPPAPVCAAMILQVDRQRFADLDGQRHQLVIVALAGDPHRGRTPVHIIEQ
ncbi:MAG: hypothetical protein LH603_00820 [Pseudonocardia sp.]|nr:hypothetical protein [Pseudonocardia sp.]